MTKLTKPVRRETGRATEQGRPLIVGLEPGDLLTFRQKGCRKTWTTTLLACFHMAVKAEVAAGRAAKTRVRRFR